MNAGVQSIDSAILLGESYDTALTTLLESDKNRRLELRFDGIYRHIYFVPMNAAASGSSDCSPSQTGKKNCLNCCSTQTSGHITGDSWNTTPVSAAPVFSRILTATSHA